MPLPAPPPQRAPWIAAGVLLLAVLAVALHRPIADWLWPDARALELVQQGDIALSTGRLTAPDGQGARELYAAALALDPDRPRARAGLAQVGEAALRAGNAALDGGHLDEARRMLSIARDLQVPRAGVDALAQRLRTVEASHSDIERMLQLASLAHRTGKLDGTPDAAAPLYARVLALQPGRTEALEGREDVLADLLQQARGVLQQGDLLAAAARMERVRELDPGHVVLPEALAALAQAAERRRAEADAHLAAGRLEQAEAAYLAVVAVETESASARTGLSRVAESWLARARRALSDDRPAEARAALSRAAALDPQAPALAALDAALARDAGRERLRLVARRPTAAQLARVRTLVEDAAQAEARGDLISPPGANAFDLLRAARAIAPDDGLVRAATARLLPQAQACFDRELRANRLVRAGECLDAWQTLGGPDAGTRAGRTRLSQRWIAVGDERLGAGDLGAARSALEAATRLDAAADGLADLAARVRTAAAAN